ncbi:tRNA sulfurtransferase [Paenibacillus aurantius]|uniref:tRNA sulfurtransferase n=1 Tax=Paenibacillus aurantius TaxID=2918900 RepID=UPI0028E51B0B|nr:7-cyano-7-deazaguanine synthase [Paenibacillus aurantius]
MLMLSGGIDSPVAGWLAMRRGLEVEAVHFHSYPYTSERAKQKVVDITRRLSQYTDRIKLHLVPFTDIQTNLNDQGQENLMITLMRRSMFRITERLASRSKAGAVITGESLGQVASQTLPSLHAIGKVAALPILRPLIMMDKAEITHWSEHIGTYEISILPYEDCCTLFVPRSPATNPNIKVLDRMEASMEWLEQAEEAAAERTETLYIRWNEKQEFDEYF